MQNIGTIVMLIGIVLAIGAQLVGAAIAFRSSVLKGVLSLLVPGYILIVLRREGMYGKIVGSWVAGILGMVIATVILS